MRNSFVTGVVGLVVSVCLTSISVGQYTYASLERLGLQRNWSTMVDSNPSLSGIAGIAISVNQDDAQAITTHELEYEGGFKRFSPFDMGQGGEPIGVEEALRLAEVEKIRKEALGRKPILTTKKIKPVELFVSTTTGVLQSINAETGKTNWSISVGSPRRPTSSPAANDWYVAVINGSQLFVVDRDTGEPVFDRELQSSPMVGSSRSFMGPIVTNFGFQTIDEQPVSEDWIYVPCTGGRLEAYSIGEPTSPPWFTTTRGDVVATPAIGAGRVAWTNSIGYLQVADARDHEMRFRLQTGDQIDSAAAYLSPGRFFVAARNGYLYAIDEKSENIVWEFSTAQPILDRPIAVGGDVFVTTQDNTMFCVGSNGLEKWTAAAVNSFLSASENRVYAVDDRGQLTVLSRKTGVRLGPSIRVNARPIINTETDRIYVASRLGQVYCFSEIGSEFPTIHHQKEVLEEDRPFAKRRPSTVEEPVDPDAEESPSDFTEDPVGDEPDLDDDSPFNFGDGDDMGDDLTDDTLTEDDGMEDDDFGMDEGDDDNPFDFGDDE